MGYEKFLFQFFILIPIALLFVFSGTVVTVFLKYDSLLKNTTFIAIVSGLLYFTWRLLKNFIQIKESRIKIALAESISRKPGLSTGEVIADAKKSVPFSFMFGGVLLKNLIAYSPTAKWSCASNDGIR